LQTSVDAKAGASVNDFVPLIILGIVGAFMTFMGFRERARYRRELQKKGNSESSR